MAEALAGALLAAVSVLLLALGRAMPAPPVSPAPLTPLAPPAPRHVPRCRCGAPCSTSIELRRLQCADCAFRARPLELSRSALAPPRGLR